jgi:hypothetical protein
MASVETVRAFQLAPNPEYRRWIVGKRPFEALRHRCQDPVSHFITVLVVDPDEAIDIHQTACGMTGIDLTAEALSVRTQSGESVSHRSVPVWLKNP